MLAPVIPLRPVIRQTRGETPLALSEILEDGVNLAVWQRQLPLHIAEFGALLVALGEPLNADSPQSSAWSMRIYDKPFVRWIWAGGMLMMLGGFVAAADRRFRHVREARRARVSPAAESPA